MGVPEMHRNGSRFKNHLDENLVHLHKNLYISQGDPLYYEKVIRYLDPKSPEAHFQLGQKHQIKGNFKKALFHYKEVLRIYPSSYYSAAHKAVRHLEARQTEEAKRLQDVAVPKAPVMPPFLKMFLLVLLLVNLLLLLLYFGIKPISKTVSSMLPWGISKQVTYETVDIPYVMNFPADTSSDKVESILYKKALELGKKNVKQSVLIYGMVTTSSTLDGKASPLTDESQKDKAFVIAEYYASVDQTVKIRFLNRDYQKLQLTEVGTNLVRTAIAGYVKDYGAAPKSLSLLLADYPSNYLSYLPLETLSKTNALTGQYDGKGGWVYDASATEISQMFYPNIEQGTSIPYQPFELTVSKKSHQLRLLSGDQLIWEEQVGLGANGQTPAGSYEVEERVVNPRGSRPDIYGYAGLGLGAIAIHGTLDNSSIGANKSLGCIRLSNSNMEQLYSLVPKGTEVIISEDGLSPQPRSILTSAERSALLPAQFPALDESPENMIFKWLG
jgi:tetratricopeptide (TPR) repeat protein